MNLHIFIEIRFVYRKFCLSWISCLLICSSLISFMILGQTAHTVSLMTSGCLSYSLSKYSALNNTQSMAMFGFVHSNPFRDML